MAKVFLEVDDDLGLASFSMTDQDMRDIRASLSSMIVMLNLAMGKLEALQADAKKAREDLETLLWRSHDK